MKWDFAVFLIFVLNFGYSQSDYLLQDSYYHVPNGLDIEDINSISTNSLLKRLYLDCSDFDFKVLRKLLRNDTAIQSLTIMGNCSNDTLDLSAKDFRRLKYLWIGFDGYLNIEFDTLTELTGLSIITPAAISSSSFNISNQIPSLVYCNLNINSTNYNSLDLRSCLSLKEMVVIGNRESKLYLPNSIQTLILYDVLPRNLKKCTKLTSLQSSGRSLQLPRSMSFRNIKFLKWNMDSLSKRQKRRAQKHVKTIFDTGTMKTIKQ